MNFISLNMKYHYFHHVTFQSLGHSTNHGWLRLKLKAFLATSLFPKDSSGLFWNHRVLNPLRSPPTKDNLSC